MGNVLKWYSDMVVNARAVAKSVGVFIEESPLEITSLDRDKDRE